MWVELVCGLVIYQLFKRFFYDDEGLDIENSDSNVLFAVGERLAKLYGGKVYVGLQIPDADTGRRQNVDMVHVANGEAVLISVWNKPGFVSIDSGGSWVCIGGHKHKTEHYPDPVAEAKQQVAILESYLEQRGAALPDRYISCKVICPNPKFQTTHNFPSEVVTYDQWVHLKTETANMFSGWIKGALRGGKKEMQEPMHQTLNFILSTAPMWDRLELKNNKIFLGEFLEFKGKKADIQALKNIRRSKVSRLIIQKTSMLGFAPSTLEVLYCPRDCRSESASGSEWKEVTVKSSTEIVFQPRFSSEVRKFKLSSVVSLSLSG